MPLSQLAADDSNLQTYNKVIEQLFENNKHNISGQQNTVSKDTALRMDLVPFTVLFLWL